MRSNIHAAKGQRFSKSHRTRTPQVSYLFQLPKWQIEVLYITRPFPCVSD